MFRGLWRGQENLLFLDKVHHPAPYPLPARASTCRFAPISNLLMWRLLVMQTKIMIAISNMFCPHHTPPPHHPRILCQYNIRDYCSKIKQMPRDNNLLGLISNYALDRLTIPQYGRCSTSVSLMWCVPCQNSSVLLWSLYPAGPRKLEIISQNIICFNYVSK